MRPTTISQSGSRKNLTNPSGVRRALLLVAHGKRVAEAYSDWPGDYEPVRLPWPPGSDTP